MKTAGQQSAGMRWARWSAVVIIVIIGVAAFVLSFAALRDLAILANTPKRWAWLFPVIVDGTIIQATVGALVLAKSRERKWFLWVLAVGAVVSVAGNSVHAVAAGRILPGWAAALVAAIAPISLLVDTHGLAVLFRAAQQDSHPEPVPVPDPVPAKPAAAAPVPVSVPARKKASTRRDPGKVAQAVAMHVQGKTFAEIGRALGISAVTAAKYAKSAPAPVPVAAPQPAPAPAPAPAPVSTPVPAPVVAPVRPVPVRSVHPVRPVQQALPITVS
ncbi:DUF2637 domain-containing protein [Nocardia brasiliensis]|uniref:DUF2637 domain-containing protein n=1 Tax=Nocardia brasiliensis TaxID=37326 RepID=UPI002454D0EF|nr:DUF2637 domain-containing protein [Nocardia brasiliensis]